MDPGSMIQMEGSWLFLTAVIPALATILAFWFLVVKLEWSRASEEPVSFFFLMVLRVFLAMVISLIAWTVWGAFWSTVVMVL